MVKLNVVEEEEEGTRFIFFYVQGAVVNLRRTTKMVMIGHRVLPRSWIWPA